MCKNCQKRFKNKTGERAAFRVLKLIFKHNTLYRFGTGTHIGGKKESREPRSRTKWVQEPESVIQEAHQFKGGGDELFHNNVGMTKKQLKKFKRPVTIH